jgi:hypothetical protein
MIDTHPHKVLQEQNSLTCITLSFRIYNKTKFDNP